MTPPETASAWRRWLSTLPVVALLVLGAGWAGRAVYESSLPGNTVATCGLNDTANSILVNLHGPGAADDCVQWWNQSREGDRLILHGKHWEAFGWVLACNLESSRPDPQVSRAGVQVTVIEQQAGGSGTTLCSGLIKRGWLGSSARPIGYPSKLTH